MKEPHESFKNIDNFENLHLNKAKPDFCSEKCKKFEIFPDFTIEEIQVNNNW